MDLLCISAWYIEGLCLGGLGVLWCLVLLHVLRVLSLNLPLVLCLERILLLCILCLSVCVGLLELFLVLTILIFFCILANGTVWSPSTSLWFWCCCTGGWLVLFLGLNLYREFMICGSSCMIRRGKLANLSSAQKGCQTFFLPLAKEY